MTPPLPQPVSGSVSRADGGRERTSSAGKGPFVINLCSSTTPMALEQEKLGELKQRFTFFVSRRREDGRERFRLHMGYFDTENEAEEWLAVVRDIYPGAWTGEAPGKRLREREVSAVNVVAAAVAPAPVQQPPSRVLAGIAKLQTTDNRLKAPAAAIALDNSRRSEFAAPASAARAPTEFSVTFEAAPQPSASAYTPPQLERAPAMLASPLPASAPDAARSALAAASASAQAAARMAAPPPVLVVPTLQGAPAEPPPLASIPILSAPIPTASPVAPPVAVPVAAPVLQTIEISAPKIAPPSFAPSAPPNAMSSFGSTAEQAEAQPEIQPAPAQTTLAQAMAQAPRVAGSAGPDAKSAPPVAKLPAAVVAPAPARVAAKFAPPVVAAKSAPKNPTVRAPLSPLTGANTPEAAAPPQPAKSSTNSLSNVAEVLASLDERPGHTQQMPALPAAAAQSVAAPPNSAPSMSDTQVLRYLENRRADGTTAPATATDTNDAISMLRPDDTSTVRALKEAVTANQPVSFAVQLKWSVQPIELSAVPPLAIFSAYTLYTVEGSREGRKWFGLRLGFFTDAISAKQVAYYVRSEFSSVAVVPVSTQERSRATDAGKSAVVSRASGAALPKKSAVNPADEIRLFDTMEARALANAESAPRQPAATAPKASLQATAKAPPAAKAPQARTPPPASKRSAKGGPKVRGGGRERRSPQSLEETLEILGADQLELDNGRGELLNDLGAERRVNNNLKVAGMQPKNSPFSRLLDRLSERVNKS